MNPEQYLDALLSLPGMVISQSRMVNPKVSPDKKWVAGAGIAPAPPLMFTSHPPMAPPRHPSDRNARNSFIIEWMPDSRAVILSQDESGNERDQLFRVDLDCPGVLVPLTSTIRPST